MRVEPFSFYCDLLQYPFSKMSVPAAVRLSVLLAIAQIANAAGFFWTMLTKTGASVPIEAEVVELSGKNNSKSER